MTEPFQVPDHSTDLPKLTLEDLAATANREATLAYEAGTALIQHAINCGEALLEAKAKVPHGEWQAWLAENFDRSLAVATQTMRIARNKRIVIEGQATSFKGALRMLHRGDVRDTRVDPADVQEALRLRKEGCTYREIADTMGVNKSTAYRWCNPDKERARLAQAKRLTLAGRRELNRRTRDAQAKKAGGAVAEAYALVRKALQACERATTEARTPEVRRAVQDATNRLFDAEDAIVRASKESGVVDRTKMTPRLEVAA